MEQIENMLKARTNYLIRLKEEKERALQSAPEGSLRICCKKDKAQYYQRNNPKDFNGVYIRSGEMELAQKLAQKDYDEKVLYSIEKELNAIKKYFSNSPVVRVEEVYDYLHKERQKLIEPVVETEEQFLSNWEKVVYKGKEIDENASELYTIKGERVRSKSEVIIADILNRECIPYRYEYPFKMKDGKTFYPDFTVLNVKKRKEIYWEHLGMMDDTEYVENALRKIALYEKNGIFPGEKLILTYETKKVPINLEVVRLMIQQYLK